ncbi:MAG TPA: GAF domain-containing protein [Pseudonocardia sp.]|jgi:signal transduction histidine kinase|uniref:GAF domain-containing sensor histidine kinase n=1 Tax=Pseudonocardia sp. TaxID=60912 RepID=UPI002BA3D587|nr:GAF domain-containing protein [Pseudonocardia sp.]HTF51383.1 GAF domain-containing protein [Pseudonocardia sp.]
MLAEEQAALRRVAMLVASGTRPEEVFAAVLEEVGRLLPVDMASLCRYESDGTLTWVANWGRAREHFPVGSRRMLGGKNLGTIVFETGRSARLDNYADISSGPVGLAARETGLNSSLATPIVVEGRIWGVIAAGSTRKQPVPADTEARLASFTDLVATAIANAESRAALAASRARIVAAADEARRRIERDLHDGTQQQLISVMLELRLAESSVPAELVEARRRIGRAASALNRVIAELREISCGIHPAILSEAGLGPALRALARRSAIPVELSGVPAHRLPEPIEVAAYYVVSESLTNAAKHADASQVDIEASARDSSLRLSIRDDGVGGAEPARGSGLVGLRDRVEALGGLIEITSPAGHGTHIVVQFPLELDVTTDHTVRTQE